MIERDGDSGPPDAPQFESDAWLELGRRGSRAAFHLALRSAVLRGLTFIGTIALARLLSPSDFGVYGIVFFVVSVWSSLGDFGLGAALVQQAEEPTPAQLRTVWTVQQCISVVAVAVLWLAAPLAGTAMPGLPPEAPWMLRVLSLGLLMSSLRTLPAVMMERRLQFGPLAAAEILQMITFYSVAVFLAVADTGAWAFVVAGVAQLGVGALVVNLAWRRRTSIGVEPSLLGKLLGFGFHYQAAVILITLRDSPLPALVGLVSGTGAAGITQFAVRIALTIASIDEVVARIAFPALARLQGHPAQQARALEGAILMTGLIVIPAQCWIAAVAPVMVPLVFGAKWADAIIPLQIMCLGTLLRFPARYLRQAEFADGASRLGLGMTFTTTTLAVVSFAMGLVGWGIQGAAAGFLTGSVLGFGASIWLARRTLDLGWSQFWRLLGTGSVAAAAAVLVVAIVRGVVSPSWQAGGISFAALATTTVAGSLVFGVVCTGLLLVSSRPVLEMAWRLALRGLRGTPEVAQRG